MLGARPAWRRRRFTCSPELPAFRFLRPLVLPQGVLRLAGPTGGYLMSYPFAAFVAGWLAERGLDRRYITLVLAMACGLA